MPTRNRLSDNLPSELGFEELVKEANAGDQAALAKLRKTLDENPLIWQSVGNLALHARMTLVKAIAGGDQLATESLLRHAFELESSLVGPLSTPLERLAVQRIVACWLETHYAALQGPEPTGDTLKQAKFALQVRESAEKRFHAAVKSLCLVKKMLPSAAARQPQTQPTTPAPTTSSPNPNGTAELLRANGQPPLTKTHETDLYPVNRLDHLVPSPESNGHVNRLKVLDGASE